MKLARGHLYFTDKEGHVTKAKLKSEIGSSAWDAVVQDCPKKYVHHPDEICRKCGRNGVAVANAKVEVKQDPDKPIEPEILAEAIVRISAGMQKLTRSGLNRDAIEVLLHDASKIARRDIKRVLDSLDVLARRYTR